MSVYFFFNFKKKTDRNRTQDLRIFIKVGPRGKANSTIFFQENSKSVGLRGWFLQVTPKNMKFFGDPNTLFPLL